MRRKNGFTLIELLAVIVILAIIALISTPIIIGVIEKARMGAFEDSAYGVLDAGRVYFVDKLADQNKFEGASFPFPEGGDLKISGEKPAGGTMMMDASGNVSFALYDKDKKWCALKLMGNEKIEIQDYNPDTCKNLYKIDDYVKEGLVVQYDGFSTVGKDVYDENSTTWKNLASNSFDAVLKDAKFQDHALYLDGIDDWASIGEINNQNITIEIVTEIVSTESNAEEENIVIANYENGGYGISLWKKSKTIQTQLYENTVGYTRIPASYKLPGKMYLASIMSKDFRTYIVDNRKIDGEKLTNDIKYPESQTVMMIGANPKGNLGTSGYYNGKVYAVRIYNRVLTDKEIVQNRQTDYNRFKIATE